MNNELRGTNMKKTAIQTIFAIGVIITLISGCNQFDSIPKSVEKAITAFSINGVEGSINGTNISITLPAGTAIADLVPEITVSPKATVSPASGEAQDFTGPVSYTVTAEDGTTQAYIVTVETVTVETPEKELTGIEIARLPNKTVYLLGEFLDLTGLAVNNIYNDGSKEETSYFNVSEAAFDPFTAGIYPISLSSKTDSTKTASFEITVSGELVNTGLPVIYIETENAAPVLSKDEYVSGTMTITQGNTTIHENTMRIKGRGNATWGYPKKPYKIKLDEKTNFFGMGKDKDWVLLANYCDKTLLRTGIAFKLSEIMGFPWTPEAVFVELVMNGNYLGNYQLVEGIKQDGSRVNVSKDSGYIIERDGYYLQEPKYFVTDGGYGYSFKHPDTDDLRDEQRNYILGYMNNLEAVLSSDDFGDPDTGYQQYIDIDSFVRWYLFHNIMANIDTNPYLTKDDDTENSKICMGPVWDFEWSLGIGWYGGQRPRPAHYWVRDDWYYETLLKDAEFITKLKTLWDAHKTGIQQGIIQYISEAQNEIRESQELNFKRWDILNSRVSVGGIPLGSFAAEIECDKQFFNNHMDWLDTAINGL
jgi:hypothetical protein